MNLYIVYYNSKKKIVDIKKISNREIYKEFTVVKKNTLIIMLFYF